VNLRTRFLLLISALIVVGSVSAWAVFHHLARQIVMQWGQRVADIQVREKGSVRRAKLYYLRHREGKATRIEQNLNRKKTQYPRSGKGSGLTKAAPGTPAAQ